MSGHPSDRPAPASGARTGTTTTITHNAAGETVTTTTSTDSSTGVTTVRTTTTDAHGQVVESNTTTSQLDPDGRTTVHETGTERVPGGKTTTYTIDRTIRADGSSELQRNDTSSDGTTVKLFGGTDTGGNWSYSESIDRTDGGSTVLTRTVDADGDGQVQVTTTDAHGTVTDEHTDEIRDGKVVDTDSDTPDGDALGRPGDPDDPDDPDEPDDPGAVDGPDDPDPDDPDPADTDDPDDPADPGGGGHEGSTPPSGHAT